MDWQPGKELNHGKYRIEKKIGRGGFAITYKVLHLQLNASVVIKTPNEYLIKDVNYNKYTVAFIKEAQILKNLPQNLNIVQVTDLFFEEQEESSIPCIVMNFVSGKSLQDIIKSQKKLSEEVALKYISKIGKALDFLHQNGLVHRDVHPGNIIISDEDKPILIDFGLAIEISPQHSDLNNYGHPQFIAPEQKQGNCQPTVDIYALAATLYYILTGKYAQKDPKKQQYIKQLKPPKNLNPTISDAVNKAILKGLNFNPSARPRSMTEWLKMLQGEQDYSNINIESSPMKLISVCGINYKNLERFLKTKNWYAADWETTEIMCKIMGENNKGKLAVSDIINFPSEDLKTINELWLYYSNHKFGFTVQKEIYRDLGGTSTYDEQVWKAFCQCVGEWKLNYGWFSFSFNKINKSPDAPLGHLPILMYLPELWLLESPSRIIPFYRKLAIDIIDKSFMGYGPFWAALLSRGDL